MHAHDSSTSTLDPERAQQMRDFLLDEVRQAPAVVPTAARSRAVPATGRRVLVGIGAASIIGAGLFGLNAVVGGPGPASVDQAVAIETEGGWTTIRVKDPDATPEAVLAQLEAAGIAARIEEVPIDPSGVAVVYEVGGLGFGTADAIRDAGGEGGAAILHDSSPGQGGLLALTVSLPNSSEVFTDGDSMVYSIPNGEILDGLELPDGDPAPAPDVDQMERFAEVWLDPEVNGVRLEGDGVISLRNDTDAEVVVVAAR